MRNWNSERSARLDALEVERQFSVASATTDLVAIIDMDGFFISLNPAGYEMLALDQDADISRIRLAEFYTVECLELYLGREIPNAIRKGDSSTETEIVTRTGALIPSSQVMIAHKDKHGGIKYFSIVLRDIRSIKEAERERQDLVEQLSQSRKIETVGRLAGGVAHDLNNIMSVIMGYAELGIANSEFKKQGAKEFEIILDSAEKAARLSNQLLDFSSKQIIHPQVLNVNEVVYDSSQLIESMLGKQVAIKISVDSDLWPVNIDRSQLEQVILNLAANSRDAFESYGTFQMLTANISVSPSEAVELGLENSGDYVRLVIRDDGCGIDCGILDRIFEPFFTTKEKGKGTGLGLSAAIGAIKQNNGHMRVSSEVNVGTTFEVYFPRASSKPEIVDSVLLDTSSVVASVRSGQVLLVDDEVAVRDLLSKVLRDIGYTVLEATDGVHALELLEENGGAVDLVVSDVVMPRLNGVDLFNRISKANDSLKMILISGHAEETISPELLKRNNVRLLKKPFPLRKFVDVVTDELEDKHSEA